MFVNKLRTGKQFYQVTKRFATTNIVKDPSYEVIKYEGATNWSILFTCEHASNEIPKEFSYNKWGPTDLKQELPTRHWGYDPGARQLTIDLISTFGDKSKKIKARENGVLVGVCSRFTRLLLDPNRDESSVTMFRSHCDNIPIDLNANLTEIEKEKRKKLLYFPYHQELGRIAKENKPKLVFSIHSFNPIYEGSVRKMEVGILFDEQGDELGPRITKALVERGILAENNAPWSGKNGCMFAAINAAKIAGSMPLMVEARNDKLLDDKWRSNFASILLEIFEEDPHFYSKFTLPE